MQEEWYEPTRRDILRAEAFESTSAGKRIWAREREAMYKILHWRVLHGDYKLRPEDVQAYEEWLARHPEFDAPRKHK